MRIAIRRVATLTAGALVLTGCVGFESFPRTRIVSPRPHFTVEERLLTLREDVPGARGGVETVPVGWSLWVLLDPDPLAPVIRYVASNLEVVSQASTGFYDAGLHQAKYTLTVRLEGGGQEQQVQTVGTGRSGLSSSVAAYEAVDDAIASLYQRLVMHP